MNTAEASSNVGIGPIDRTSHTVTCGVPQINCLYDIWHYDHARRDKLLEQVADWVTLYPDTEHIYKFEMNQDMDTSSMEAGNSWLRNCIRSLETKEQMDLIIAGSYALWTLSYMMNGWKNPGWKANDIDIFLLDRTQHARHSPAGGLLDIVHTMDKTPEEVITNFDLPCCRVAFSPHNYTFYISIHALYSLATRKVRLPRYLKDDTSFRRILRKFEKEIPSNRSANIVNTYHEKLIVRMSERIKKYQSRGFSFKWYDTEYILPWIRQRFCYVNFDLMKDPFPEPILTDRLNEEIERKKRILQLVKRLAVEDPTYEKAVRIHTEELDVLYAKTM